MPGRNWLRDDPEHPFEKVSWLHVLGRLKPGVTVKQAQANVDLAFARVVADEFAGLPENERKEATRQSVKISAASTGVPSFRGDTTEPLFVLMGIVAMVLLIACANVANLLLARATARQKEIDIRLALGAQRARVIRQFLAESILLAVLGGIGGVGLAYLGVTALLKFLQTGPDGVPLDVMNFEIRTTGDPGSVIQAARAKVREVNPLIDVDSAKALTELLDGRLVQEKIIAQLSGGFGALALLLASIGLYGVLSYGVALRTNELGIRMALGAQQGTVIGMILRETSVLIAIGLAARVPAALACGRLVQSKLYGLKAADPLRLGVAVGILVAVALIAGFLPARRASQVDPLVALRYE
jgi:ABC-type antimicrobial peptide transport system permease subunit